MAMGTWRRTVVVAGLVALAVVAGRDGAVSGEPSGQNVRPDLALPVDCRLGETCFIQSYVDVDPGQGVVDYACGSATYEGHDGTDFRVPSAREARAGVAVLAAAAGVVKATRDGMVDQFPTSESRSSIANRECGNGVVVEHGGGWETQYCHMRSGSIAVGKGDRVETGTRLGHVGFSGLAEFAHLHFTVRKDGAALDPFLGAPRTAACVKEMDPAQSLWSAAVDGQFRYANGEILTAAFTGRVPKLETIEEDGGFVDPRPESAELVFYTRLMNLRGGDQVRVVATGPEGFAVDSTTKPIERNKATFLAFGGKRLKAARWAAGTYRGQVQVLRDGRVIAERTGTFEMP
ncbi:MAG: M23 family metallopeptidase [Hyphomicrobium sp.]|nr:M23 family metallopeptidase [Hyphomicrobium sp.]